METWPVVVNQLFVSQVYPGFVARVRSEILISEESAQEDSPDVKGMLAA